MHPGVGAQVVQVLVNGHGSGRRHASPDGGAVEAAGSLGVVGEAEHDRQVLRVDPALDGDLGRAQGSDDGRELAPQHGSRSPDAAAFGPHGHRDLPAMISRMHQNMREHIAVGCGVLDALAVFVRRCRIEPRFRHIS